MDVRAADAARHHLHHDIVGLERARLLGVMHPDASRLLDGCDSHCLLLACSATCHPFTAPMVKPFTSERWANQPRISGGRTTRVEMALSFAQKRPSWVMKLAM